MRVSLLKILLVFKKNGIIYFTLIVSDQFKTEGKWKDDKLHGEGKITFLKDIDKEEKGIQLLKVIT